MRARTLKPGFFKNEVLAQCDPFARLLFQGLWCMADCKGRLEDRPGKIKAELFPFDQVDVDRLLQQLHDHALIVRYVAVGQACISIPKFAFHQRPHPKEGDAGLPAPDLFVEKGPEKPEPGKGVGAPGKGVGAHAPLMGSLSPFPSSPFPVSSAAAVQPEIPPAPSAAVPRAPDHDADAAAEVPTADKERQSLVDLVAKAGLTPSVAARYTASADPALLREILAFHQSQASQFRNPVGALRSMLADPGGWGFCRDEHGGWKRPPPLNGKAAGVSLEERIRRQRDATRRSQEEASAAVASPGLGRMFAQIGRVPRDAFRRVDKRSLAEVRKDETDQAIERAADNAALIRATKNKDETNGHHQT